MAPTTRTNLVERVLGVSSQGPARSQQRDGSKGSFHQKLFNWATSFELYRTGTNLGFATSPYHLPVPVGEVPTTTQLHTPISCSPHPERLWITNWGGFADASYLHFIDALG
ncbi:hypothetical protein M407DRAFT_134264 [Tulasnella calospora MUT 4182]|uniref:Uncharacterized protein n=1 Tax=Tulasnella calospora MUT 4182 TaxID=1051891 RepID=A0A0C3Q8M9_9AGAM|nr:hypothetical protein M407DRAFT_134264 [Tulasnella calospora MUT 4182]